MLFILEEGASFWSTSLTWRAFFCSSVTLLTVIVMDRSLNLAGEDMTSNFSFGKFSEAPSLSRDEEEGHGGLHAYLIIELSLFFLLGCVGGLLGGIFVTINGFIARLRKKYVMTPWRRLVEILFLVSLTAWMTFTVPLIWSVCSKMPEEEGDGSESESFTRDEVYLVQRLVQFDCPTGHYNQVASLFYVDSNTAIKLLFHFREHMSDETFDTGSLIVVLVPYFVLACATCGIAASAGVFVSCLVSGAVMGRLCGHLLHVHFRHQGLSDAGTYALVGAAAMIGGVCRNTISLTVMMVEATGNLDYVLPIMLALLSAKYVGDLLSPGLYYNLVQLRDLPWLAESIWGGDRSANGGGNELTNNDITSLHYQPISEFMSTPVVYLREAETVGTVYETLQTTTHNLFPVLDGISGQLQGTITRSSLLEILHAGLFSVPLGNNDDCSYCDVLCPVNIPPYPPGSEHAQSLNLETLRLSADQFLMFIDMRPYIDPAPHVLFEDATLKKSFTIFRTLGLRHLVIINRGCKVTGENRYLYFALCQYDLANIVTGIITRKDLIQSQLLRHFKKQQKRQLAGGSDANRLLQMSLSSSQQLNPLRLSASSCPEAIVGSVQFDIDQLRRDELMMDTSQDSRFSSCSNRGPLFEEECHLLAKPTEEMGYDPTPSISKRTSDEGGKGGRRMLDFFFVPNKTGQNDSESRKSSEGVQLTQGNNKNDWDKMKNGSDKSDSCHQQSFGRVRLTK